MEPEVKPRDSSLPAALVVLLILSVGAIVLLVLLNARGDDTGAVGATEPDDPAVSGPFNVLYGFDGYAGAAPTGGVAIDPDGEGMFMMPSGGGTTSFGTVVRFDLHDQTASELFAFDLVRGGVPSQVPVLSKDGETMYGTASRGGNAGAGALWRMNADGTDYEVLMHFAPPLGSAPQGPPLLSKDGSTLFGATSQAGPGGYGTLYRVGTNGKGFSVLHAFTGGKGDGGSVLGGLTQGPDGTLFGMTFDGGPKRAGTIFRVEPDGRGFRVIHEFAGGRDDGSAPQLGHLALGPDGDSLYGMTRVGGTDDEGTIFRIEPDGRRFAVLHSFSVDDGTQPYGSVTPGPDGKHLYGLTSLGGAANAGVLFRVGIDGTSYEVLHDFERVTDGGTPLGAVAIGEDGTTLYGVTTTGSVANAGTIFSYDLRD